MTNVLETGFEFMDATNPNGSPKIKGYNIINGKLQSASNGETFESRNPALLADCLGEFPLSTKDDVHQALKAARDAFLHGQLHQHLQGGRSLEIWADYLCNTKMIL